MLIQKTCSDEAWHKLWRAFNTNQTEMIRVDRSALAEVVACHGGQMPDDLIHIAPREGSDTVSVYRHSLFNYLNLHGAKCDAG